MQAPEPERHGSLELALQDPVVELAFLPSGDGSHLLVLGRHTLSMFRIEPRTAELLVQTDLLAGIDPLAHLARYAQGCLQFLVPPDRSSVPWLHLFSTGLGSPAAGSAAFRVLQDELIPQQPAWLESEGGIGACDAFQEAAQQAWPGRALVLVSSAQDPAFLHLSPGGRLIISGSSGEERSLEVSSGEPLAAVGSLEDAWIYLSSPALPGDPDRVVEYHWDGVAVQQTRRSREFQGRLAAMVLSPGDGRFVVAETDAYGSRLHILREDDLWREDVP